MRWREWSVMKATVLGWRHRGSRAATLLPGHGFYVSIGDQDRLGLLAGPFDRLEEALGMTEQAETAAEGMDLGLGGFSVGVCRAPTRRPAALNSELGVAVAQGSAG